MCVGSKKGVTSPYGADDLAGNVWEWIPAWFGEYYYIASPAENSRGFYRENIVY